MEFDAVDINMYFMLSIRQLCPKIYGLGDLDELSDFDQLGDLYDMGELGDLDKLGDFY